MRGASAALAAAARAHQLRFRLCRLSSVPHQHHCKPTPDTLPDNSALYDLNVNRPEQKRVSVATTEEANSSLQVARLAVPLLAVAPLRYLTCLPANCLCPVVSLCPLEGTRSRGCQHQKAEASFFSLVAAAAASALSFYQHYHLALLVSRLVCLTTVCPVPPSKHFQRLALSF